jgi:hypothetical protein
MAQIGDDDIIRRLLSDEVQLKDGIPALVDRMSGLFLPPEGPQLDYKQQVQLIGGTSVAEIARDVLAFSNTEGGLLILGVADDRVLVGHDVLDLRRFRDTLGPYIGTRVSFDVEEISASIRGGTRRLFVLHVRRSLNAYPNLLRKDIEFRPGLVRKLKYPKGTLFYRLGDETFAESPYGDIESRARELRFSGAAPRTRTSFLLQEDRPGLRLYAPINDRFFGRDAELADLISKFDDPRGRGVSIAGFGGFGKTELAIRLVSELHRRGKFKTIYSASAKQTLLGPGGVQQTDPVFIDLESFLTDLAGWLGLNVMAHTSADELSQVCLAELVKDKNKKLLLFVDNLETVTDRRLLSFLDNELPANCWLVATARVHKVRNFVYPKELLEMDAENAARLLRHELKRQGLEDLAGTDINELKKKAEGLYLHPLALRWFAWACKKSPQLWNTGIRVADKRELETFCVADTLGSLDTETQKVLGAILAISDIADVTPTCVQETSGLPESSVEKGLWELECCGLVYAGTGENGTTTYTVASLAERPASDLARSQGWEGEYVANLRSFLRHQTDNPPESALVRDLLKIEPRQVQDYILEEKRELVERIQRALPKTSARHVIKLKWLRAECERHMDNLVTADDLYRECADAVLPIAQTFVSKSDRARILVEGATLAKLRAQTDPQLRRAVGYLEAIRDTECAPMRVIGMLTEFYAMLGEAAKYGEYRARATKYIEENPHERFDNLDDALNRAKGHFARRYAQAHG